MSKTIKHEKTDPSIKSQYETKKLINSKFRVIPNLSLKGKDIMTRLNNRSLIIDNTGQQYSLEEEFDSMRKMHKTDLMNAHRNNHHLINSLQNQLKNGQS